MDICNTCADKAQELESIKGDCRQIGGLSSVVYFADVSDAPLQNVVYNTDGSVASFSLGKCNQLHKLSMRQDLANVVSAKTTSENGLIYQQTANLFVNDLSDQATKDKVFALENADKVLLIYQTNYGAYEIAGFNVGLKGTGGQRLSGALRTEVSRDEIVLTANEKAEPITLDAGSLAETKALLELLATPNANNEGVLATMPLLNGAVFDIKTFDRTIQAVVILDDGSAVALQSIDNGVSYISTNLASGNVFDARVVGKNNFLLVYNDGSPTYDVALWSGPDFGSITEDIYDNNGDWLGRPVIGGRNGTNVFAAVGNPTSSVWVEYNGDGNGVGFTPSSLSSIVLCEISPSGNTYVLIDTGAEFQLWLTKNSNDFELVHTFTLELDTPLRFSFVNDELMFMSDEIQGLYRSADGGITWQLVYGESGIFHEVVSTDFGLFVANVSTEVLRSTDCGETWEIFFTSENMTNIASIAQSEKKSLHIGGQNLTLNEALISKIFMPCAKTSNCE